MSWTSRLAVGTLTVVLAIPAVFSSVALSQPASLFPLAVNAEWVYREADGTQSTSRITGSKSIGGTQCFMAERMVTRSGQGQIMQACYVVTASDVLILEATSPRAGLQVLTPPQPMLRLPPAPGQTWAWNPQGGPPIRTTGRWVGEETVRVPAGEFRAWKAEATMSGGPMQVTTLMWLAPGVGLVRSERTGQQMGQRVNETSELVRYRIP